MAFDSLCEDVRGTDVWLTGRQVILNPSIPTGADDTATFSVISYNILADCHVQRWDYGYTDPVYLTQDYRHTRLMAEVKSLDGDLVCLQEVGPDYYKYTLYPAMQRLGYKGVYMKRTLPLFDEGCATFFKTKRFSSINVSQFSIGTLILKALEDCDVRDDVKEAAKQRYADRPDVLLVVELRCEISGRTVIIGNTHIIWGEFKIPDVQTLQVLCALQQLTDLTISNNMFILCGDFNAEPDSAAYKVTEGHNVTEELETELTALKTTTLKGTKVSTFMQGMVEFLKPKCSIRSAYKEVMGREPAITSMDNLYSGCLDYVFYGSTSTETSDVSVSTHLLPVSVLDTLPLTEVTKDIPPSCTFPSDHFPLKVNFTFTNHFSFTNLKP